MRRVVGSCVHRPDGLFGRWQLHDRLFPIGEATELWADWERIRGMVDESVLDERNQLRTAWSIRRPKTEHRRSRRE